MTDGDAVALMITAACTGVATLITSIGGLIVILRTKQSVETKVAAVQDKVAEVAHVANGLASRAEIRAHLQGSAEGNIAGRKEQAAETRATLATGDAVIVDKSEVKKP